MSDSSSLSEVEVSPSSDSLDTLIGLSTETGRTTAVTPSSSSEGIAASSDAAAASSDSSRPETPRQEGNNRVQDGDPSGVPVAGPSSGGHLAAAMRSSPSPPHRGGDNRPRRGHGPRPGSEPSWDPASNARTATPSSASTATAAVPAATAAPATDVSSINAAVAPRPDPGRTQAGARRHGAPPCPPLYRAGTATPAVRWPQPGGT